MVQQSETYEGHCHCGTVQYKVTLSPPLYAPSENPTAKRWKVVRCNCSMCHRNGYLLVHPKPQDVEFTSGKDKLGQYLFATKLKPHLFCKECGSSIGIDMTSPEIQFGDCYGMNVRMLRGVDLNTLEYVDFDGEKELGPAYEHKDAAPSR